MTIRASAEHPATCSRAFMRVLATLLAQAGQGATSLVGRPRA
ncbi:hypothetical protein LJR039_007105 [Pseudorhodoferax sp. LjRoot39]|jgi:hypothetical protein